MKVSLEQLSNIFSSAFGEKVEVTLETKRADLPVWDSVNHLNLIVELEEQLNVSFLTEEIPEIKSVKDLMLLLEKR